MGKSAAGSGSDLRPGGGIDPKFFLDSLDREMASLQMLITFTTSSLTIALGLVLGFGKDSAHVVWSRIDMIRLPVSAALLIASMALFFLQRSTLAWLYGQISLSASGYDSGWELSDVLREADSWRTWLQYRWGWRALLAAYMEATSVVIRYLPETPWWIAQTKYWVDAAVVLMLLAGVFQTYAFSRWPYSERPFAEFFKSFKR